MIVNDIVYGKQKINDKTILSIIKTKEFQRLRHVHQHSVYHLVKTNDSALKWIFHKRVISRFEHSLGVYLFLRKFNVSLEEQIAGLIHDISHFAFSHVADFVFNDCISEEFAEKFSDVIIKSSSIPSILKKRGINTAFVLDKRNFTILESDMPNLCADRIDYFLRDSLTFGFVNKNLANKMLNSIIVYNNKLVIDNAINAKLIAKKYLIVSKNTWSEPLQTATFRLMADAIKLALKKEIIKESDLFLTDDILYKKLKKSKNKKITDILDILENLKIRIGNNDDYDFYVKAKARYIDPNFLDNGTLRRVSEVDENFKKDIKEFQECNKKGFYIKIIR